MRHVVPVDREPSAADVRTAREPDAATVRKLLELVVPVGGDDYFVDALAQTDAADSKIIRSDSVRLHKMLLSHLDWIESEFFSNLVDVNLKRESRLRRAVPALW